MGPRIFLSLNCIIPLVDAVGSRAFVDIGAGTGLQLISAAIIGQFHKCFGVERNVVLVEHYKAWCKALRECDEHTWGPILDKIQMVPGQISECSSVLSSAGIVLCWNACFEPACNATLFRLVAEHMLVEGTMLVLTVGLQDDLPNMKQVCLPSISIGDFACIASVLLCM